MAQLQRKEHYGVSTTWVFIVIDNFVSIYIFFMNLPAITYKLFDFLDLSNISHLVWSEIFK